MNIIWKINELESRSSDGFVTSAHWECTATDGEIQENTYSVCDWNEGTLSTPFSELTEQQVLDWIWKTENNKDKVEKLLKRKIDARKAPIIITDKPW